MKTEKENEVLAAVIADHNSALQWLMSAYRTHLGQVEILKASLEKLRSLYLAKTTHPLSVEEAQMLNVCRICRGKYIAPFTLNYYI